MTVLLICATVYDVRLSREVRRRRQRADNMAADTGSTSTDLKLDLNGLNITMGKGYYHSVCLSTN